MKNRLILLFPLLLFSCKQPGNKGISDAEYYRLVAEKIQDLTDSNDGVILQDQKVYWGNDTVNSQMLSEYATQKILFFYFSYNTCSPCIERSVEYISEFVPDYLNNEKVIFLSPDYMPRFRENCYGKRLLGLENDKLGIQLEEEEVPFFFILSADMKINNLHIVNKNDFNKTSAYLKKIRF
jgi:hypothetical protein